MSRKSQRISKHKGASKHLFSVSKWNLSEVVAVDIEQIEQEQVDRHFAAERQRRMYAALGIIMAVLFSRLSRTAEATTLGEQKAFRATFAGFSGLDRSRDVVVKLSALFALDSFGGGFVVQGFAAYWFYLRNRQRRFSGTRRRHGDSLFSLVLAFR